MITASDPRRLYPATATAELLPSPGALDEAHVAAYHRDSFLAVANLLSPEEVATARAALDDMLHGRVPGFDGLQPEPEMKACWAEMSPAERAGAVRKVWLFAAHEPRMAALTRHPMVLQGRQISSRVVQLASRGWSERLQVLVRATPSELSFEQRWPTAAAARTGAHRCG